MATSWRNPLPNMSAYFAAMNCAVASSSPSGFLTEMPYWRVKESGPVGTWQLISTTSVRKPL